MTWSFILCLNTVADHVILPITLYCDKLKCPLITPTLTTDKMDYDQNWYAIN